MAVAMIRLKNACVIAISAKAAATAQKRTINAVRTPM